MGQYELKRKIELMAETLGLPLEVEPFITAAEADKPIELEIRVNDQPCWFPDTLLHSVYALVKKKCFLYQERPPAWHELGDSNNERELIDFLSWLLMEVIRMHPERLFTQEVFRIFWMEMLPLGDYTKEFLFAKEKDGLFQMFREILALQISLADIQVISSIISEYFRKGDDLNELREEIITALKPKEILIYINKQYFREISRIENISDKKDSNTFSLIRDGLFYELGIHYPDFRIEYSEEMEYGCFQYKINNLLCLPVFGLKPDELLVNEVADKLNLYNLNGEAASNPVYLQEYAIIKRPPPGIDITSLGLTSWTGLGYLVLHFSGVLRSHSFCMIDNQFMISMLNKFAAGWPRIKEVFEQSYPLATITQVFRMLMKEEIPIRNFRQILEAMLEADYIPVDPSAYIVLDKRVPDLYSPDTNWKLYPENLLQYARGQIKETIGKKYLGNGSSLMVYLLDPELEKMILNARKYRQALSEEDTKRMLKVIELEAGSSQTGLNPPAILTSTAVRQNVRQLIADRFPSLAVLAYRELPPSISIQPLSRISLE